MHFSKRNLRWRGRVSYESFESEWTQEKLEELSKFREGTNKSDSEVLKGSTYN